MGVWTISDFNISDYIVIFYTPRILLYEGILNTTSLIEQNLQLIQDYRSLLLSNFQVGLQFSKSNLELLFEK